MSELKMTAVKFQPDFLLEVYLTNGHGIIYNLKPKLATARFKGIDEGDSYHRGLIMDGNRIVWENSMELSLDEILNNISRF